MMFSNQCPDRLNQNAAGENEKHAGKRGGKMEVSGRRLCRAAQEVKSTRDTGGNGDQPKHQEKKIKALGEAEFTGAESLFPRHPRGEAPRRVHAASRKKANGH